MRKRIALFLFAMMIMMLFVSCGKEEEREFGIDGYVYVAEQVPLKGVEALALNCLEANGKLYYVQDGFLYYVPVEELEDFQKATKVKIDTDRKVQQFAVDEEGNIYWRPMFPTGEKYMNKYIAQTGENVKIPLAFTDGEINAIAAGQDGRVWLLLDNAIWGLDQEGNVVSQFSSEEYRGQDGGISNSEILMADSQGNLFYLQGSWGAQVKVLYQGTREWVELTGLPEMFSTYDFFLTTKGKIYINAGDALYEYDLENAQSTPVLHFYESNLNYDNIRNIVYLDEERLCVIEYNILQSGTGMYLLTRTPAEEVPHKKTIVLASLSPSQVLEQAVVEFNQMNEEYYVVIERYGATSGDSQSIQAARTRLESSLVSSNPPDLLDMDTWLSVSTYAEKDVLADLYPYLKKSDVLDIEDYLENVVEGYTVNGRLVCLPVSFMPNVVIGRTSQVGSGMGWTFEDLNAVLEQYPDMKLLMRNYMLYYFLYDYYVYTFIDAQTGECNFDSDEFREFVQWIERYKLPDGEYLSMIDYVPADVLVDTVSFSSFTELNYQRARFGDDITFLGHVTKTGTPSYDYQSYGKVGIVESTKYKNGAWAFLEYFISSKGIYQVYMNGFPTNREELMKVAEEDMKDKKISSAGTEMILTHGTRRLGDESITIYAATQEDVDILLEVIENIDFTQVSSSGSPSLGGIVSILLEELGTYYNGQKSLEEVTKIINNRAQVMVDEIR